MKLNRKKITNIVIVLIATIAMGIAGMYLYVHTHKKEILAFVQQEFSESYNGTLTIRDIEPDMWEQFPNISLALRDVVVRDRHWQQHHIDVLNAKNIYFKLQLLPLLIGKVNLSKLIIKDAVLTIYEGENHLSNKDIFKKKTINLKKTGNNKLKIKHFELKEVIFRSTNIPNKKNFDIRIPHLHGCVKKENGKNLFETNGNVSIHQFCFNTAKGSYFKNKTIKFNIAFSFDETNKILTLKNQTFNINGYKIKTTGDFYLDSTDQKFDLVLDTDKVDYKEGLSWLPKTVKSSLDSFVFEKPINFSMHIQGKLKNQRIPFISIASNIVQNNLNSKMGKFDSCNFKLLFVNGHKKQQLFGDQYSFIRLENVRLNYHCIPLQADTIQIYNLKKTYIKAHVKSVFSLEKLNNLFQGKSFLFGKGEAQIDIRYAGALKKEDHYATNINGTIGITKGELSYLPRQLKFHDGNVLLQITNNEIKVVESILHSEKSEIKVSAESKNFISLYRNNPGDIVINATVWSNKIDLNEFQTFLKKRTKVSTQKKESRGYALPDLIDEALDVSKTNLDIKVKELFYKNFVAKDIDANITLLQNGINFNRVGLRQSGGLISMQGNFTGSDSDKPSFQIDATIRQAAIDQLFYSFDNFGQKSFNHENLKGTIDIKTKLSGLFNSNAKLIPHTIKGSTSFEINKGALVNFNPLMRMGKLIFKKERLTNINFEHIDNTLTIEGNKIQIPPMWVNSDLIDFKVQGVYNLNIGTDVMIEIPLFKFTKKDIAEDPGLQNNPGYRLYIRGKDNENGELKFSLKMRNADISAAREERRKNKALRKQRLKEKARNT